MTWEQAYDWLVNEGCDECKYFENGLCGSEGPCFEARNMAAKALWFTGKMSELNGIIEGSEKQ